MKSVSQIQTADYSVSLLVRAVPRFIEAAVIYVGVESRPVLTVL